jgi:hypothetical protein
MPLTPERAFDLYFNDGRSRKLRPYRGRARLDQLQGRTLPSNLLSDIQKSLNEALAVARKFPDHSPHDPLHLDYVDSEISNALAFCYGGYAFIGVTIPLTTLLWDICHRLSTSAAVATALGLNASQCDPEMLHVVLFRAILNLIVSHEWAHHVRGHVSRQSRHGVWIEEVRVDTASGSMATQSLEADADGYAAYFGLAHLIDSTDGRPHAVRLLNLASVPTVTQDQVLFSCFLCAFAGFVFVLPAPPSLDAETMSRLSHPPQAARLHFLMQHAHTWCRQNRPLLFQWITVDRFQMLMATVANVMWGNERRNQWAAQVAFLGSPEGRAYSLNVIERLDTVKAAGGAHQL